MNKTIALIIAGIIFSLVALAHIMRLYLKLEIIVAGHTLPMNISVVGLIISLILAVWMFLASRY